MSDAASRQKTVTVDRLEGQQAVLADERSEARIPAAWLPEGCREGSAMILTLTSAPREQEATSNRVKQLQGRFTKPGR